MQNVKVNNWALVPILVAVGGFLMSPDFYNLLPDKWAHIIAALALAASTIFPQLFKKHEEVGQKESSASGS